MIARRMIFSARMPITWRMRLLASLLLIVSFACAPAAAAPGLGLPAPVVTGKMLDGRPLQPRLAAGKVTILNFWATWCPPCRAETPDLIAAYAALHERGVDFLGIDTTESAPIVKTFLSAKGVPYPTVLSSPSVYNAYGIAYIPTTVVVDAHGVVRARWVGGVTPKQLAHYVDDARAGRFSIYVSPVQARIDALLAPEQYRFDGNAAERAATIEAIQAAIARAEVLVQGNDAVVDYERTINAEGALRIAAGTAERDDATTDAAKIAAFQMIAEGSGNQNLWADAVRAYRDALAVSPDAPKLVSALSRAYYRLHDYDAMIEEALRYTRLAPADGDGWSSLGLAYQRAGRFADAAPDYEKALALLRADATKSGAQDALANVADTALDAADVYVSLGDAAAVRRSFALANAYGDRLTPKGRYAGLKRNVKERTQEGLVAVALSDRSGKPVVSVVPWSGPDLPGSLASTLKYRLIVAAPADKAVTLEARGLPPKWVASFCADGLCSPHTVSFASPSSGVKTYEFQLVPPHDGAQPGSAVTIAVRGGSVVPVPAMSGVSK